MSILIKNMEMPKRGETITVTICDDGLVFEEYYKGVFNAVSIPQHGELIDRSKIHKAIPAEEDNCTGMGMSYDEMDAYNDGIDVMYDLVQKAKPIIEAEPNSCDDCLNKN